MKFYILLIIAFIALNLSADEPTKIRIKIKNQITEFKIYGTEKEVISALQEKCTKLGVNVIYRPFINSPAEPPILDDLDSGEDDPFAESNDPLAEEIDVQITSKFHKFNFDLKNISILQLVRYITIATGLKYKIDDHAIVIASPRITGDPNTIHLYEVTKEIVFLAKTYAESEVAITDSQVDKLYWQALGINFYSGSSIAYLPNVNKLVMTNYESEHRRLKELLEELKARLLFEQKPEREFLKDRSLSEYKINFPKIRFQKETFGNAIAFIANKVAESYSLNVIAVKPKSITLKLTLDADDMPLHDLIHFICEELQIEFILEDDVLLVGDITKDAKHHLALYTMPEDLFEIIGAKKDKVYQKYFAEQGLQLSNRVDLKVLNNFQIILVDGTLNDHKLFNKIIDDLDPTFIKTELDRVLERIIPKFRFSGTLTDAFIALVEETVQKNVEAPHLSIYQNFTIDKNHKVHLDLENIPVKEVISYICKTHNLHHQQDTHAIAISDLKANPQKSDSEKIRAMQQKIFELQEEVNQFKDGFQNIHQKIIQTAKRQHKPISKNLNVVIPKIRFNNRDLLFVVDFIRRISRDLSDEGEGINIVLGKINTQKKVNIDLDDVPISELIRYICDQLDLKYTVEDYAVIIRQK